MPAQLMALHQIAEAEAACVDHHIAAAAVGDQLAYEAMQIGVAFQQCPVEPAEGTVLGVGVVVALLAAADLIAHRQHRCAD